LASGWPAERHVTISSHNRRNPVTRAVDPEIVAADVVAPWPSAVLKIVIADGVAGAAELARELARELPGTTAAALDLSQPHPAAGVLLVVLRGGEPAELLAAIVGWAGDRVGLIAYGSPAEVEHALAAGFDDAVVAGVSVRELVARVRAVHRRVRQGDTSHRLRFGPVAIDGDAHTMWVDGVAYTLTTLELAVMRALVRARGRILTRGDLLDAAWGDADLDVSERAVDNVILRLRRKLARPAVIETVRGVGFRIADA
jgi:DNA-binding response OmpR family regulator